LASCRGRSPGLERTTTRFRLRRKILLSHVAECRCGVGGVRGYAGTPTLSGEIFVSADSFGLDFRAERPDKVARTASAAGEKARIECTTGVWRDLICIRGTWLRHEPGIARRVPDAPPERQLGRLSGRFVRRRYASAQRCAFSPPPRKRAGDLCLVGRQSFSGRSGLAANPRTTSAPPLEQRRQPVGVARCFAVGIVPAWESGPVPRPLPREHARHPG
jgi:hypothetical protein